MASASGAVRKSLGASRRPGGSGAEKMKPLVTVKHIWEATQLANHLQKMANITYSTDLGVVDFFPSEYAAVLFINQADIIAGNSYRRKAVQFRQACTDGDLRGVVIVENTSLTLNKFTTIQKFVCIELGLFIIPVDNIEEAAQLLYNMTCCEAKFKSNPFRIKRKHANTPDQLVLATLTAIDGLDQANALILLERFKSLEGVAKASLREVTEVIAAPVAKKVYNFFHSYKL